MSGQLVPDATGTYEQIASFNGKAAFRRLDGAWYIWYLPAQESHVITAALGTGYAETDPSWYKSANYDLIEGPYDADGTAEGVATVTLL